jgi:hypothetical protein
MTHQEEVVLNHIRRTGSITPMEADCVHRIRQLPARIFDLKRRGYAIRTTIRKDVTGQRYAHYTLGE